MTRQRRHFTSEQKVALLREHLVEKDPVSDLCENHGRAVNNFYHWQKPFFENDAAAFTAYDKRRQADTDAKDQQLAHLQAKLQRKHEVLVEVLQEYVQLKKELGGL